MNHNRGYEIQGNTPPFADKNFGLDMLLPVYQVIVLKQIVFKQLKKRLGLKSFRKCQANPASYFVV